MALTPEQEAEAIEIELELRRRAKSAAPASEDRPKTVIATPSTTDVPMSAEEIGAAMQRNPYAPQLTQAQRNAVSDTASSISKKAGEVAVRGGPAATGAYIGSAIGPVGTVVGGALGAIAGEIAGDTYTGEPITPGKLAGAGISGAVPVGSLAGAGVKQLAKESGKIAAGNVVGKAAETLMDENRLPTAGETAMAAGAGPVAAGLGRALAARVPLKSTEELNLARQASFRELRDEGVKILPGELDAPLTTLQRASGATPSMQENLSKMNGTVWNKLARRVLGLPENSRPIRQGYLGELPGVGPVADLNDYRRAVAEPYRKVDSMAAKAQEGLAAISAGTAKNPGPKAVQNLQKAASADIEQLRMARDEAREAYKRASAKGRAEDWAEFRTANANAEALEAQIEDAATAMGDTALIGELRNARKLIAQSYAIENATDASTGIVNAISLGKQLNEGVPLSGELRKIADFANSFYREAIDAGTIGSGASRSITGTLRGAAVQPILLSDYMQNRMASPADKRNFASFLAQYLSNTQRDSSQAEPEQQALYDYVQGVR